MVPQPAIWLYHRPGHYFMYSSQTADLWNLGNVNLLVLLIQWISPYFSGMNKQKEKKAKIFNKSVSDILVTQNMRRSKDKENLLKLLLPWTFQKISHARRCQTSWSFYGYQLPPSIYYCYTNPNTFNLLDVFSATLSSAAQSLPPFPNIKDIDNKYFTLMNLPWRVVERALTLLSRGQWFEPRRAPATWKVVNLDIHKFIDAHKSQ